MKKTSVSDEPQVRRILKAQSRMGRLRMRFAMRFKRCMWLAVVNGTHAVKRLFDVLISIIALILAAPLMTVIALLIRRDGGPVFFKQRRIGFNGRDFEMLKFRSMCIDAEARLNQLLAQNEKSQGITFKMKNDPRITPVGRFMRRFSIDELPQFLCVFKGEMSLVGPRPLPPGYTPLFTPREAMRLQVRPGLCGLAQAQGRNAVPGEARLEWDARYVERITFLGDLRIIRDCLLVLLRGQGVVQAMHRDFYGHPLPKPPYF